MTRAEITNNSNEFRSEINHLFDSVEFNKLVNTYLGRHVYRKFKMGRPIQTRNLNHLKLIYDGFRAVSKD